MVRAVCWKSIFRRRTRTEHLVHITRKGPIWWISLVAQRRKEEICRQRLPPWRSPACSSFASPAVFPTARTFWAPSTSTELRQPARSRDLHRPVTVSRTRWQCAMPWARLTSQTPTVGRYPGPMLRLVAPASSKRSWKTPIRASGAASSARPAMPMMASPTTMAELASPMVAIGSY